MALPSFNLKNFGIPAEETPPKKEGFLKSAAKKIGEFGKALGEAPRVLYEATKETAEEMAQGIAKEFFATSQTVFDTWKKLGTEDGLKEAAKKIIKPDSLITTPLGPAKKALDILELDAKFVPQTELQKKLVGGEKPVSFESIGRETADIIDKGQAISKPSAIGLGLVMAGLDLWPGSENIVKVSAKQIAKIKNADEIFKILKNVVKGDDRRIRSLANGLTGIDDAVKVEKILNKVKENPNKFLPPLPKLELKGLGEIAEGQGVLPMAKEVAPPAVTPPPIAPVKSTVVEAVTEIKKPAEVAPAMTQPVKPVMTGKLTEGQAKNIFIQNQDNSYDAIGKYQLPDGKTAEERAIKFIDSNKDKKFFSPAVNDNFEINGLTKEHFFGKNRTPEDYARRAKLLTSGIEIAENSKILAAADDITDKAKGITYYEILGTDSKNFPGKIIDVKLTEQNKQGKKLWTIVDIKTTKKITDISGETPLPKEDSLISRPKPPAVGGLEARPPFSAVRKSVISKFTIPQPEKIVKPEVIPSPVEFAAAKKAKEAAMKEFKGKEAIRLEVEAEARATERAGIRSDVVQGIKNSRYYRKEKDIKDVMGEGYLMSKKSYDKKGAVTGENFVVSEKKDVDRYMQLGYKKVAEIDSIASEAGFESGYKYLEDQLRRSKVSRATTPEGIAREEFKQNVYGQEYQRQKAILSGQVNLKEYYARGANILEKDRMDSRRARIRAVRDYFGLSDDDLHTITRKDPRYMGEQEFVQFLDDTAAKAVKLQKTRQAKNELIQFIKDREFRKTENLQKAMKLPSIEQMTEAQIKDFHEALLPFQHGDEFLSTRKLETIDRTDMVGIKTLREARERFVKDVGVTMMMTDADLKFFEPSWTSRFRYDSPLARQNKYFGWIVDQNNKGIVQAEFDFVKFEKELNNLTNRARASVKRGLVERAIPQDKLVFKFLEMADPAEKMKLQGIMTKEELDLAGFLQAKFAEARDYLTQNYAMTNFKEHYITHVRRRFLEALKSETAEALQAGKFVGEVHKPISKVEAVAKGLKRAFSELLDSYKQDEEVFKILEGDTGEILPLEKFFAYSLHRAGKIPPTENVAKAASTYFRTFYKKQQLDAFIPKAEIFNYILTPTAKTPRGLEMDRSIQKFVRQWINTKKGRMVDFSGMVRQGGPVDLVLRGGRVITSLIDLGVNIPVQFGAQFGEQVMNIKAMGFKNYGLGVKRLASSQGRKIVSEYESFIGKSVWDSLTEASKDIGQKLHESFFAGFRNSSRQANKVFLLGEMTAEEFAKGNISAERLGELRTLLGRHRVLKGAESVFGATSPGKTYAQYKEWAFVPLQTAAQNWTEIGKKLIGLKGKELIQSRAFQEEVRGIIIASAVGLLAYGIINDDEKDESFVGKVIQKSLQDALSTLAVIDPRRLATQARLEKFVLDIGNALTQIVLMEKYKKKEGLKGVELLKRTLTPRVLKKEPETKKEGTGQFKIKNDFEMKGFKTSLPSLKLSDF